jgi:hypothetical protein
MALAESDCPSAEWPSSTVTVDRYSLCKLAN